jgi:hypothetical protein
VPHSRPGPASDMVTKDVCKACNAGWMERLETDSRPVLTPMITGNDRALSAADQFVAATWATKTMLTMQGTNIGKARVGSPPSVSTGRAGVADRRACRGRNIAKISPTRAPRLRRGSWRRGESIGRSREVIAAVWWWILSAPDV